MHHTRITAVHCGASHVAYGLFSGGPERLVLERFATESLDAGDLTEENWLAAVGAALRRLLRGKKLRAGCMVGLPGHLAFNRSFRIPPVTTARQRREIIAFEQRQGVAAGEEMVLSDVLVAEDERGQEMMLAVAKRRLMEKLGERISEAGLYPEAVLPAWLVLRHAIGYRPEQAGCALVLSVGARSSQFVSCQPGGFSARTIAVGGGAITRKIADELEIDFTAAETLKLRCFERTADRPVGERERAAGQVAFDQFVCRLCAEILRSPPMVSSGGGAARPAVLLLTGGGARLQGLPAALAERLQLRIERWELRSHLALCPEAADLALETDDAPLIDLIGLAAYATKGARREGNLLPRSFRREMFVRCRGPRLAVAALMAVVVCLAPAARPWIELIGTRRQTEEVEATISVFQQVDARNRSNIARLAETDRRIEALRKLSRARSGWIALFGDLQERLTSVQDVWLDGLQIIEPGARESAASPTATAAMADARPGGGSAGRPEGAAGTRLLISGRMLDAGRPAAGAGDESSPRTELLLSALRASPLVGAVERGQFAGSQPGLVSFEITLRPAPDALF